jgi:hypothetical protein
VVADADYWKIAKAADSGFSSRMTLLTMSALAEDDAKKLVVEPFGRSGIEVDARAVKRCVNLAARQPCYLQAICKCVYNSISRAPDVVDVVSQGMVEEVLDDVLLGLSAQFETMYAELATVISEELLNALLSGESRSMSDLIQRDNRDGCPTFAAIPGLVVTGGSNKPQQIEAVELFCCWAVQKGYVRMFGRHK